MPGIRGLLVVAVTGMLSRDLQAQSAQAISLQASGLYNGVFGKVFTGLRDGAGAEAQLRYTPGALSIGAGFQYTDHGLDNLPGNAQLYGGFVEPRYRIHAGSNVVAPYLSARFSLLKVGFSDESLSLSSSFIQLNGGGGLLFRLGSRVNMDVGATYGYDRLSEGTLTIESDEAGQQLIPVGSSSGSNVVVRLGFAFGVGG